MDTRNIKAAAAGGGLGLTAAAVVWLFATFAQKDDVAEMKTALKEIQAQVHEIHTQVVVLDAIRANKQISERKLYE